MKLLSMLVEVYNEEKLLPYCLDSMLPYVDECIIVDGSEDGISTDKTAEIVHHYEKLYPSKIKYLVGTFRRDDGSWDETGQVNLALQHVEGKFLFRTHADIIYARGDVGIIRDIVDKFPEKKIFATPMIELFYDTEHVRFYCDSSIEPKMPRSLVGDVPVIAMQINPRYVDEGEYRRECYITDDFDYHDVVFMPFIRRYHFGWVKSFDCQVRKHVKYVARGDYGEYGTKLKVQGAKAVYDWAVSCVLDFKNDFSMYEYADYYPPELEPLRDMNIMDGYEEFLEHYKERFGEPFRSRGVGEQGSG